jgi:hypothetical protein
MEMPLHVRVAEALGCEVRRIRPEFGTGWSCGCPMDSDERKPHGQGGTTGAWLIARYDTDWSATGPLIDKYGIALHIEEDESSRPRRWIADYTSPMSDPAGVSCNTYGATALEAICNVILAVAEAGYRLR